MPVGSDISTRKMRRFVRKLTNQKGGLEFKEGAKHSKLKVLGSRSFTLPFNHGTVNRFIVNDFLKFLEEEEVISESEAIAMLE